jgi:hypothetical protein
MTRFAEQKLDVIRLRYYVKAEIGFFRLYVFSRFSGQLVVVLDILLTCNGTY